MSDGYSVAVPALTTAASALRGIGGDLGGIDGAGPLHTAASALPGSSTAGAATALAAEVTAAIRGSARAVRTLGDNAESSSRTYSATDDNTSRRFGGPQ
jgi:hypothetical protein